MLRKCPQKQNFGKRSIKRTKKKGKGSPVKEESVAQEGALTGQRGANGARRGRKTKKSMYLRLSIRLLNRSDELLNINYGPSAIVATERPILKGNTLLS